MLCFPSCLPLYHKTRSHSGDPLTTALFISALKGCVFVLRILHETTLTLHLQLPSRYTWQDLKDLIRQSAEHGIWTEMAVYPNGQTGGTGWARVQRGYEAIALFSKPHAPRKCNTIRY